MQTEGKPCTKFVVPSAVLLRNEEGWRVKRRKLVSAKTMMKESRWDVPMGSTQKVGSSVRLVRAPAAYDSSPMLHKDFG